MEIEEIAKEVHPLKVRFSDAIWYEEMRKTPILLLGCGGIGSNVGFCLSRIGCPLYVYDMDLVEEANLAGQLYSVDSIGKLKTQAFTDVCKSFAGADIEVFQNGKYDTTSPSSNIVIAAFDNMAARKAAFENWVKLVTVATDKSFHIFIDGRLLMEQYQVYAVQFKDIAKYRETLFEDSEVADVACTLKSTTHCSFGIACDIVSLLTNFIGNKKMREDYGSDVLEVPFKIVRSIPQFTYEISNE